MKSSSNTTPNAIESFLARFHSARFSAILLVLLVLIVYFPSLKAGYVWDDHEIVENPLLKSAEGLKTIWLVPSATTHFESGYWPMSYTTFWIENRIWGGFKPAVLHLDNVLLHCLNVLLIWFILIRMRVCGAWLIAAVFALHPVHVESVAWVAQRKDVLSAFFYLAAFWAYLRALKENSRWFSMFSLSLYVLGMLSKSIVVTFPVALLIYYWYERGVLDKRAFIRVAPFFLVGGILAFFGLLMAGESAGSGYLNWPERFLVSGRAFWFYLTKLLWPVHLLAVYPKWKIDAGQWWQYLYPLSAVATLVFFWSLRRRIGRGAFAALFFFGITLLPVLGFVYFSFHDQSYVADRYQYLASIGPTALLISLATMGSRRLFRRPAGYKAATAAALLLTVLAIQTWQQAGLYMNMKTLFEHCLRGNRNSIAAHVNLADVFTKEGLTSQAQEHLLEAERLDPTDAKVQFSLGVFYMRNQRWEKAAQHFRKTLDIRPVYPEALNGLGVSLSGMGLDEQAEEAHREALRLDPNSQESLLRLASIAQRSGRQTDAAGYYRTLLALEPEAIGVMNNLAWILATSKDRNLRNPDEAVFLAERAVAMSDTVDPNLFLTLAESYAQDGRFTDAVSTIRSALSAVNGMEKDESNAKLYSRLSLYERQRCAIE